MQQMLVCRQTQTLKQMPMLIAGGCTESIFPVLEVMLHDKLYQKAIKMLARNKTMDRYRSLVDFWLGETIIHEYTHIIDYYRDRGPAIRYLINRQTRNLYEASMIKYLLAARELQKAGCDSMCWKDFVIFTGGMYIKPIGDEAPFGDDIEFMVPFMQQSKRIQQKIEDACRWTDKIEISFRKR